MNLEIKLLRGRKPGIMCPRLPRIAREEGFNEIFGKVGQFTHRLSGCRIVIDMRDSNYILESTDIPIVVEDIVENFSSRDSSLALVFAPRVDIFVNWLC